MEWDRIVKRTTFYGTHKSVHIEGGKTYTHDECERRLQAAIRATSRWFSRSLQTLTEWNDKDMRDYEIERLRSALWDMTSYAEAVSIALDEIEGVNRKAERILKLENVAGRTPEEAEAFLNKAAELRGE